MIIQVEEQVLKALKDLQAHREQLVPKAQLELKALKGFKELLDLVLRDLKVLQVPLDRKVFKAHKEMQM